MIGKMLQNIADNAAIYTVADVRKIFDKDAEKLIKASKRSIIENGIISSAHRIFVLLIHDKKLREYYGDILYTDVNEEIEYSYDIAVQKYKSIFNEKRKCNNILIDLEILKNAIDLLYALTDELDYKIDCVHNGKGVKAIRIYNEKIAIAIMGKIEDEKR